MGLREVKKVLTQLNKPELIGLLSDLYKKNKTVREHLDFYSQPDEGALFEKFKERVYDAFYSDGGFNYSLREGRQAIRNFKNLGASPSLVADLMLFYVETGVEFTNDFGDIDERFYASIENMYESTLELIQKEGALNVFAKRAEKVVDDTAGIGWGFHDSLAATYWEYYSR